MESGWFGCELPGRPGGGTYRFESLESLPPIPEATFRGEFDWLADPGRRIDWSIGSRGPDGEFDLRSMERVRARLADRGLALPPELELLLGSSRRNWIRSATGCWLELPAHIVSVPGTEWSAVRFLNDQQGVLFWYAAVSSKGPEAVVVSRDLFDADEPWFEDGERPETYICSTSIEAFFYRFWIENEIFFQVADRRAPTPLQQHYLDGFADAR